MKPIEKKRKILYSLSIIVSLALAVGLTVWIGIRNQRAVDELWEQYRASGQDAALYAEWQRKDFTTGLYITFPVACFMVMSDMLEIFFGRRYARKGCVLAACIHATGFAVFYALMFAFRETLSLWSWGKPVFSFCFGVASLLTLFLRRKKAEGDEVK
jgi:hypothetical protein